MPRESLKWDVPLTRDLHKRAGIAHQQPAQRVARNEEFQSEEGSIGLLAFGRAVMHKQMPQFVCHGKLPLRCSGRPMDEYQGPVAHRRAGQCARPESVQIATEGGDAAGFQEVHGVGAGPSIPGDVPGIHGG